MADYQANTDLFDAAHAQGRNQLNADEVYLLLGSGKFIAPQTGDHDTGVSIGIRCLRDFGMVIEAGVAGKDQAIYGVALRRDQAAVAAAAGLTDSAAFLQQFRASAAYRFLAAGPGADAGPVLDRTLEDCFGRLLELANSLSPELADTPWIIEELLLDTVMFDGERLTHRDCHCRFARPGLVPAPRPIAKIDKMLHPQSMGIIGVSASKMNFGRIMLNNIVGSGYDKNRLRIIRPGEAEIDGVKCVESLESLDEKLDLFVVALAADAVFDLVDEVIRTDAAESVMLIPGGMGETQKSREPTEAMRKKINAAHQQAGGGPVFLGGNCLGIISHPGNYDSWFVPAERLPRPKIKQRRNTALISQSGAFMVTRISKHPWLDPAYMIADGNQNDITHSDLLRYFNSRDDIDVIGFYIEGFRDLDGAVFACAVREAVAAGKQVVVYKAGRTPAGGNATMGHTASVAGDYDLTVALLHQAGAIVAYDVSEFTDLMYVADCLHHKHIGGNRVATISGAGFEAVAMADSLEVDGYSLEMAPLAPGTVTRVEQILAAKRLDALMEVRNPMDTNPAADDEAHLQCTVAFLEDPNIDAVISGMDCTSPVMMSLEKSRREGFDIYNAGSQVQTFPSLVAGTDKPVIGVVDGGTMYDAMASLLMDKGVCIFRSGERAMHALARYVEGRLRAESIRRRCG